MLTDGFNLMAPRFAMAAVMGGAMCGACIGPRVRLSIVRRHRCGGCRTAGQVEVELQQAGHLQEGSQSFLVAPGMVVNFGLTQGLEAVFEGRLLTLLSSSEPPNLTDAGTARACCKTNRPQHRHQVRSAVSGDSE